MVAILALLIIPLFNRSLMRLCAINRITPTIISSSNSPIAINRHLQRTLMAIKVSSNQPNNNTTAITAIIMRITGTTFKINISLPSSNYLRTKRLLFIISSSNPCPTPHLHRIITTPSRANNSHPTTLPPILLLLSLPLTAVVFNSSTTWNGLICLRRHWPWTERMLARMVLRRQL
jgi:hypothetical protein